MVKAQEYIPVNAKFFGKWFFDHAEAQEREKNSQQNYVTRSVSPYELLNKTYFGHVPTLINFDGAFYARISNPSSGQEVIAVINPMKNSMLEFLFYIEDLYSTYPEWENISKRHLYVPATDAYSLEQSGNLMSLTCNYTYSDGQGNYTEGILTIYYKR